MLLFSTEMLASALNSINLGLAPCMVLNSTGYLCLGKKKKGVGVFLLTSNVLLFSFNSQAHKLRAGISQLRHMLKTTKLTFLQPVFCRLFQYWI